MIQALYRTLIVVAILALLFGVLRLADHFGHWNAAFFTMLAALMFLGQYVAVLRKQANRGDKS